VPQRQAGSELPRPTMRVQIYMGNSAEHPGVLSLYRHRSRHRKWVQVPSAPPACAPTPPAPLPRARQGPRPDAACPISTG